MTPASPRSTGPGGVGEPVGGGQVLPALDGALAVLVTGVPLAVAAAAVALLAPAAALAPGSLAVAAPLVLTLAVLVGLPHGAVDLAQPDLGSGPARTRALIGLAYLGSFAAAVAAWWRWPLATLLALLALSVVHFGTADDVIARWRTASTPPRRDRVVRVLALGGIPVTAPFALHPAQIAPLVAHLAPGGLPVMHRAAVAVAAVVAVAAAGTAVTAWRRGDRPGAAEPLLLAALFVAVPPLLAFALYFGLWHSLRHVGRILGADVAVHRCGASARAVRGALARFARTAALPTLIALAGLGVLVVATGSGALVAALVLVLSLTVPHAAVVAWQDAHLRLRGDDRPDRLDRAGAGAAVGG